MSTHWHELHIPLNDDAPIEEIEQYLLDIGALSLTQVPTEHALDVLEPKPGETPSWPTFTLKALFEGSVNIKNVAEQYHQHYPQHPAEPFKLADQVWERVWMSHYQPLQINNKFWIFPKSHEAQLPCDQPHLKLDPGLAFGTGTHPTTAMCLSALCDVSWESHPLVLDYGCGSGILALAALKMGATRAIGIDYDAQALLSTRQNAMDNQLSSQVEVYLPDNAPTVRADVIVANILAEPLMTLKPIFEQAANPNSLIILSGILSTQTDQILAHYATWPKPTIEQEGDWVCLIFDLSAQ